MLLFIEAALFLVDRYRFLCGRHKGYSVLLACAAVAAAVVFLVFRCALALLLRRRFQFHLFSLLALTTIAGLPLSWLAFSIRMAGRQRDEVAWLREHDVSAAYDYQASAGSAASAAPPGPPVLRDCLGPDFFADVDSVWARGMGGADAVFGHLGEFTQLRTLQFEMTRGVGAAELKGLESLTRLEDVSLVLQPTVTDRDLRPLRRLVSVRRLALSPFSLTDTDVAKSEVGDGVIDCLSDMRKLEKLDLNGFLITDQGLQRIVQLFPKLRYLYVGGSRVTDAGIECLTELRDLEGLDLGDTAVTGGAMKCLAALPQLRRLNVSMTMVNDEGLGKIACLAQLEDLEIDGTPVTDAGLARLARIAISRGCRCPGPAVRSRV